MPIKPEIPNIERYLAYCKHVDLPAKASAYKAEDPADSLFYIIKGTVVLMMDDRAGREMIIDYLSEGEFFGEMGIYDEDVSERGAHVVARTNCVIGEMTYERFLELVRIYPSIMRGLDAQIVSRLRLTTQRVLDLASLDTPSRVANCLLDLCKLPQAIQLDNGVQIKISRQEISKIVGCSREFAGRILQDMQESGMIESKGMTMIVYNATK